MINDQRVINCISDKGLPGVTRVEFSARIRKSIRENIEIFDSSVPLNKNISQNHTLRSGDSKYYFIKP